MNAQAGAQFGRKLLPNAGNLPGGAAHGISYIALWFLIYLSLAVWWWNVLPPVISAVGFLARLFIIHHCDPTPR